MEWFGSYLPGVHENLKDLETHMQAKGDVRLGFVNQKFLVLIRRPTEEEKGSQSTGRPNHRLPDMLFIHN